MRSLGSVLVPSLPSWVSMAKMSIWPFEPLSSSVSQREACMPYKSYPDTDCGTDSMSAPSLGQAMFCLPGVWQGTNQARLLPLHSLKVGVQDSRSTQRPCSAAHKCLLPPWCDHYHFSSLEDNCFTVLYWFLSYNIMNQSDLYMCMYMGFPGGTSDQSVGGDALGC